jgi:hypothetical protein
MRDYLSIFCKRTDTVHTKLTLINLCRPYSEIHKVFSDFFPCDFSFGLRSRHSSLGDRLSFQTITTQQHCGASVGLAQSIDWLATGSRTGVWLSVREETFIFSTALGHIQPPVRVRSPLSPGSQQRQQETQLHREWSLRKHRDIPPQFHMSYRCGS